MEHFYTTGPLCPLWKLLGLQVQKIRASISSHLLSQKFIQVLLDCRYKVVTYWDQEVLRFSLSNSVVKWKVLLNF